MKHRAHGSKRRGGFVLLFGGSQGMIGIRGYKKTRFLIKSENNN